ncbi:GlxA family transcriptional regulator [Undibacterium sp. Ren11W]
MPDIGYIAYYEVIIAKSCVSSPRSKNMPTRPSARAQPPLRIAILAYENCMASEIFGVSDILRIASNIASALAQRGCQAFEIALIAVAGRTVTVAGGVALAVTRAQGAYDVLIVPGLDIRQHEDWDARLTALARELALIERLFASGTQVAAVCVGAFLLAGAGLLAGRKATTAWLFAAELASRYPAAQISPDAILVSDGGIITCGAVSCTFDLALHLVKRALGAKIASATARIALLPNQRTSQAPYLDSSLLPARLPTFSQSVAQWLSLRLTDRYDLATLAQAFHVSSRSLLRRVKAETGQTPLGLLQVARVDKAKQLLHSSRMSIARITEQVGYTDVATFSRLFVRQVGETPAMYRRR